tara:strand:- start:564 stop:722 length:159 start_codon:yes stop_codon:yes gene_type:complete
MMALAIIGITVIAVTVGVGAYWIATNITFKKEPNRYTYEDDSVIDNEEDTKE